jgi:hypothetical protein
MKSTTVRTLGFELNYSVPESVAEYDQLAKKDGAALESATDNVVYRSVLAKFRSALSSALANITGVERKTRDTGKVTKNEDGTEEPVLVWDETEKDHFARVCAEQVASGKFASPEAAAASFLPLAQETIAAIAFDPSESERAPQGPVKVAKQYISIAQKAVDGGKGQALADQLTAKLGNMTVEPTVDSISRAIAEDQRRIRAATKVGEQYGIES